MKVEVNDQHERTLRELAQEYEDYSVLLTV